VCCLFASESTYHLLSLKYRGFLLWAIRIGKSSAKVEDIFANLYKQRIAMKDIILLTQELWRSMIGEVNAEPIPLEVRDTVTSALKELFKGNNVS
jgi:hypothetical protein